MTSVDTAAEETLPTSVGRMLERVQGGLVEVSSERLGYLAVAQGKITPAQLSALQEERRSSGMRLEALLVAGGHLSREGCARMRRRLLSAGPVDLPAHLVPLVPRGSDPVWRGLLCWDRRASRPMLVLTPGPCQREGRQEGVGRLVGLRHPNLVPILGSEEQDGGARLLLPPPAGRPLSELLTSPDLAQVEKLRLIEQAARAVGAAHAAGWHHFNLSGRLVLVGESGVAQVLGCGLAELSGTERGLPGKSVLTGVPGCLAPEQIDPLSGELGPWTDVYALGALLHQALTGQLPHQASSALGSFELTLREPVARPARGMLGAICLKALAKAPGARHRDADALADALERWRTRTGRGGQTRRWAARLLVASGLAVGAALAYALLAQQ